MSKVPKIWSWYFSSVLRKKVLELLLCYIVMQNIQVFYMGPVMFLDTCLGQK